jgi:hypothetical protein
MEKRAGFKERYDKWSEINLVSLRAELDRAVGAYVSKGGLSQVPSQNPDYQMIQQKIQEVSRLKQNYSELHDDIIGYLEENSKHYDMAGLLAENGELQKQLLRLRKVKDEMKVDVESAVARDELLRSRETDVNAHKLFLLDRPVRKAMIPYLWVLSFLFVGIAILIFKQLSPTMLVDLPTLLGQLGEFFGDSTILISLLVAALITILFLSLKIAGVFGK